MKRAALVLALIPACKIAVGASAYLGGAALTGAGLGYAHGTRDTRDHDMQVGAEIGVATGVGVAAAAAAGAWLGTRIGEAWGGSID